MGCWSGIEGRSAEVWEPRHLEFSFLLLLLAICGTLSMSLSLSGPELSQVDNEVRVTG